MKSLVGHLLIAAPSLVNDFFSNTVVLMLRHSEDGALGVVLNRPSGIPLEKIWNEMGIEKPFSHDLQIGVGGPCDGPLIAVHNSLAYAEEAVLPGIAMSTNIENLKQLVMLPHQSIRIFCGYAGWSPRQLESECDQGGWYTIPARPNHIFGSSGELWRQACSQFGDGIMRSVLNQNQIPDDPEFN